VDEKVICDEKLSAEDAASRLLAVVDELERRMGGNGSDGAHWLRGSLLLQRAVNQHNARTAEFR
jgi:hypothetical protein